MATTTYGVVPEGFVRKTLEVIVHEMQDDEHADIGADFDVSTESVPGQMNGIVGRQLGMAWENLELAYHGVDPDATNARLLEMLAKLTGTFRRGSTASEVTLTCNLDTGTVLTAGTHFAALQDKPDIRYTPKTNYTAGTTGMQPVIFVSEILGPTEGFAGTINVIATPVVGWHTVVNANDCELGKEIDPDPQLRIRRERELASIGSATVRAVLAKVSKAFFDQLETLIIFENETDSIDANGLPPHSLEVLIFDGLVPTIGNDALAQVIHDSKAGGIQTSGNVTAHANAIVSGVETTKVVKFSRASQLQIYIEIDLVKAFGYPGDAAVRDSVAQQANARFTPGRDVAVSAIEAFPFVFSGVERITAVRLGLTPSPVGIIDIPVSIREVARFSSARVVVTST